MKIQSAALGEGVRQRRDLDAVSADLGNCNKSSNSWESLLAAGEAYIGSAEKREVDRIVPAGVLATAYDASAWPGQNGRPITSRQSIADLIAKGVLKAVDSEAASRLLSGTLLVAAQWVAASDDPPVAARKMIDAYRMMAGGLVAKPG